jgi:mannose-1-phosphate guanylyltransferase
MAKTLRYGGYYCVLATSGRPNGDSYFAFDLPVLLRFHQEHEALAMIALAQADSAASYGLVEFDIEGRVTGFREKQMADVHTGWINAGVYAHLNLPCFPLIPGDMPVSLEREIFPQIIQGRFPIFG